MTWQPGVCLIIAGNKSTTRSNLIGSGAGDELMTEMRLVLGGGLVLDQIVVNTAQHHIAKDKLT